MKINKNNLKSISFQNFLQTPTYIPHICICLGICLHIPIALTFLSASDYSH